MKPSALKRCSVRHAGLDRAQGHRARRATVRKSVFGASLLFTAFWISGPAGADPDVAACPANHAQWVALIKEEYAAGGCPLQDKPAKIPTMISDDPGVVPAPAQPACKLNAQAMQQWKNAHGAQLLKVEQQDAQCQKAACPAIDIPLCPRLGPGLPCDPNLIDTDADGIPDAEEAALIARFAPYLRFTSGEDNHPIDPIEFIKHSDLVAWHYDDDSKDSVLIPNSILQKTPLAVLDYAWPNGTSLIDSFAPSADYKRCVAAIGYSSDSAPALRPQSGIFGGDSWTTISSTSPVGMFAHVSPFIPDSPADLPGNHYVNSGGKVVETAGNCALIKDQCTNASDPVSCKVIPPSTYVTTCKDCIKIEYYQFFAYDTPHKLGITDHEGDLSIVSVIYDRDKDNVVSVSHWVHGIEIRFDLQAPSVHCAVSPGPDVPGQAFTKNQYTCQGANVVENLELMTYTTKHLNQIALAQNNVVSFMADPAANGLFEHPIVFVERGGHEFWPTADWSVYAAPSHAGDDLAHSYLPQTIPNLGEIEHPAGGDAGKALVNFVGRWGATQGFNASSPGPSLHTTWNWFVPDRQVISCKQAEN